MHRTLIAVLFIILITYPVCAMTLDVEADTIKKTGQRIEASGNVLVSGEDMTLKADYVAYDTLSQDLWASGECFLKEEKGEIRARTLYYNAKRKDVQLEDGSVFIYAEPMIISGKSISRYGEDFYMGDHLQFTPCLGTPPAWSMAASSLEIPLEGYATAWHARFNIRHLPVLYVPYLLYPAKLKRQSGLLFPEISHATDYGYRFSIPLYIVLGQSADMTVTPSYLTTRGLLMATELRYRLDYQQYGEVYFENLFDKKGGQEMEGGVLDRIPDHRWYLKALQTGGPLTWDINLVSHEDYFRDIGTFYGNKQYWKDLSSTEDDKDIEELISRMQWLSYKNGFTLSVSGQWKQDLTVKGDDKTFQELPKIKARMNQRDLWHTPLKYSSEISTTRVYSEDWIEAIKDNALLEVSWPISMHPYFTLRPYMKERYRDTFITETKDVYDDDKYQEHWQERGVSLTSTLYSSRFAEGWYHQIAPTISWAFKSRLGGNYDAADAADIFPYILSGDDWEKSFDMKLSLDNYIRNASGVSVMDFRISRIYSYLTEDWENFISQVRLQPVPWFMLKHTNEFGKEPFRSYATYEHSSEMRLKDARGDSLYVTEEYNRDDTKSAVAGLSLTLGKGFSVRFEAEHDYLEHRYESTRQGISYNSQCWSIDLYRKAEPADDDSPRETTIYMTINLLGLGDVIQTSQSIQGE